MRVKAFILCLILLLSTACSSEKPAGIDTRQQQSSAGQQSAGPVAVSATGEGQYGLVIRPADATRETTLFAQLKGINLSDGKIEWMVNGQTVADSYGSNYKLSGLKKGDSVRARVVAGGREILSNEVKVKNSSPRVGVVKILPEVFKPGDTLYVEVSGIDADGDTVTFFYEWTRNGNPAGKTNKLDDAIKRGDKIALKITPYDGEDYGQPAVLNTTVQNMPPVISGHDQPNFDGKVWNCQIKASDPDSDPLLYSLKTAPPGMAIDPKTGLLTWKVPDDHLGKTSCTVVVSDGHGGEASYTVNIDISDAKK